MNFQQLRFEAFKTQDPGWCNFDVTFLIDGKELLAHKFMLRHLSPTFAAMFSDRWDNGKPIRIETYSYNDFYQFLSFLYSEECLLTDDNIFAMVDMAEFYQIPIFKDYCNDYLKDIEWTAQNVFQILETSIKYSMVKLTKSLIRSIRLNFINSVEFLGIAKELLLSILEADQSVIPNDEEVFERVYQWAKKQAMLMKESDPNMNLDETIHKHLADYIPFFDFGKMDIDFVIKFVVRKLCLPSGRKRNAVLSNCNDGASKIIVKIIDANGRIMKGRFFDQQNIYDDIQAAANKRCQCNSKLEYENYFWETGRDDHPDQRTLRKNYDDKWCLIYDELANLVIKMGFDEYGYDEYLIAEMIAEKQFELSDKCKIVVIRY